MSSLEDSVLKNLGTFVAFARKRLNDPHLAVRLTAAGPLGGQGAKRLRRLRASACGIEGQKAWRAYSVQGC